MRIRVQRRDGAIETITLVPPVTIDDSPYDVPEGTGMLTQMNCGDGTEHYFTFDTGHYDGWGRGVSIEIQGTAIPDEATALIERVENAREIEPNGSEQDSAPGR